ncbi:MAG: beta-galactosidase [Clostridia bacterium]|nr:beta-galactosidase [Clostridia bacterium]
MIKATAEKQRKIGNKIFCHNGKTFMLNGKEFQVRSGAIHYFRTPRFYWEDRLLKLKECGFNCVETYVAWNMHEKKEGVYDFKGDNNLCEFIKTAKKLGLYVILRPGPYICAEWSFGGFPAWLLKYKDLRLRCTEETYFSKLERWLKVLFEKVRPHLITNGGNIIMMQVENEYGSFGEDGEYLQKLKNVYLDNGIDCLLFTADGEEDGMLRAGKIDGLVQTINFAEDTEKTMNVLKKYAKNQPYMCGEFWSGWFDCWHKPHQTGAMDKVLENIEPFLKNGYGFNVYMFHGGTNFGFMNGADDNGLKFEPIVTSYDYCAFLNEAGDRTPNYYKVRDLIKKYGVEVPKLTAIDQPKKAYGEIKFNYVAPLFSNLNNIGKKSYSVMPERMEDLGQNHGYVLYSAEIFSNIKGEKLIIDDLRDRAIVFVDGKKVGVAERKIDGKDIVINTGNKNARLDVLVEEIGRTNFSSDLIDRKGIKALRLVHNYKIGFNTGRLVMGFDTTSLPMENLKKLEFKKASKPIDAPAFYKGTLKVKELADTFIKPYGFRKGFIVVNGKNIGRFYNEAGPTLTMYIPKCFLKKGDNEIIIFDSDGAKELKAKFTNKHEFKKMKTND